MNDNQLPSHLPAHDAVQPATLAGTAEATSHPGLSLLDVPIGCLAKVRGVDSTASQNHTPQLLAYGLVAGNWVRVLQHSPVTIIRIDHLELALERELAARVNIAEIVPNI